MKLGFTTSFPVEVAFAANYIPLDMNNIFITGKNLEYVRYAEDCGFPRNICSWIKGMYGVTQIDNIKKVLAVIQGDCSNAHSLMSVLRSKGIDTIPFSFPASRDKNDLNREITKLEMRLGVKREQTLEVKQQLDMIRRKLIHLDMLTYQECKVSGEENHLWLVNSSDFFGNPDQFSSDLESFLNKTETRKKIAYDFRIAYLGVPPIFTDLYEFLSENRTHVVFNEIQRQFAMPYLTDDIVEQYHRYTYPYSIYERLDDIIPELKQRKVEAVICYSQAFCHRQIDNILIKDKLGLPILFLEGDQPGPLDARTKLRIESFLDMLRY